jgi:hypothetical protein
MFLLRVLIPEKQDPGFSPTSNLQTDTQSQSRQLHFGNIVESGKY